MSFFGAFFRAAGFLIMAAAAVIIYDTMAGAISTIELASINAETTQVLFTQQQETIRFLAAENAATTRAALAAQTSQAWASEFGHTARTVALLACAALVAMVIVWQVAKTLRHWLTEYNRQRAILLMYAGEFFPDALSQNRVRVEQVGGRLMLRNYDTWQQWPVEAAQDALASKGLLTVDAA